MPVQPFQSPYNPPPQRIGDQWWYFDRPRGRWTPAPASGTIPGFFLNRATDSYQESRPLFNFTPSQRLNLEGTFGENFQAGLGAVAPNFGSRYGRILQRNPFAVQSAYERANIENPNTGVLDFFEKSFNPENFAAGLSAFERGDRPSQFIRRQRRIFR